MTKGFRSKAKNVIGQFYNGLKSLTGLIILLMVYSFTGAVIFVHVETPYQDKLLLAKEPKHKDMVQLLLNLTVSLNSSEFENLRDEFVTLINKFDAENFEKNHGKRWDFWKALFFCGTIYTAIGMYYFHNVMTPVKRSKYHYETLKLVSIHRPLVMAQEVYVKRHI